MTTEPRDPTAAGSEATGPATLAGFSDRATFHILVNEERLGTMRSAWTPDGGFESESRVTVAGQTIAALVRISPDAAGRWREIVVGTADGVRTSTRDGAVVNRFYQGTTEQRTSFAMEPGTLLFDNDAVALMSQAFRRYDRSVAGPQRFAVSIGGRPPVPLTIEELGREHRTVRWGPLEVIRFRYGLPGADLLALTDGELRVLVALLPAQGLVFVREGYAELHGTHPEAGVSAPAFEVAIERTVRIPMRDGIELAADVYRPVGLERVPVVLVRTPYGKALAELQGMFFARRGYGYVAQDCRGSGESAGEWEPLVNEGPDGFDTIEWLAAMPWTDARIGMIGGSYLALAQWLAAAEKPPHLAAMIPNVSPTDPFYNFPYEYGTFALRGFLWWLEVIEKRAATDLSGATMQAIGQKRYRELLSALPVVDLDRTVLSAENGFWRQAIAHPTRDSYWKGAEFLDRLGGVVIPVFHQSGWFDDNGLGTKLNYLEMTRRGHRNQKLILGPWGHTDTATRVVGEIDFGEAAIVDLQREYLRWFDRWLKDADNGIEREPSVAMFVMGANTWIRSDAYPIPGTAFSNLYLGSGGHANTSRGDGALSFDPPPVGAPPDQYVYDPTDPTPDARAVEPPDEPRWHRSPEERKRALDESRERRLADRTDILVYETGPLTEPLTFVGPVSAVLYASTSAVDTDWFITLFEHRADGTSARLVQGKLRARYRDSLERPTLLEPNRVYRYEIDLWHTGVRLPSGSRLRVEVTSAAFPLYSRNLNTGGHNETETRQVAARQTVYHDAVRPSHVILPLLPVGE